MATEQIITEIKVDTSEFVLAEKRVETLTESIQGLSNSINTARKQNREYTAQQMALNKAYESGQISGEEYEKQVDAINKKINANNKFIAENSIEMQKQKTERNANIKLIAAEGDSRDKLRQKISLLTKEYNEINTSTEEGAKRFQELQIEIANLNDQLNKSSLAANNFKDNIGNYAGSIGGLIDGLENVPGAAGQAAGGVKTFGASLKALLANPIVLLIAAIVAGLALLFKGFQKSATGSKQLAKATAALQGVLGAVTEIAEMLAQWLEKLFVNPKEAVIELGNSILKNLTNRFLGLYELVLNLGKAFGALVTGDFDKLAKDLENVGRAVVQFQTGLDTEQQKKLTAEMINAADKAKKYADAMIELTKAQYNAKQTYRELEKNIATLQTQFDALSARADDSTLSMTENRKAAIEAGEVAIKLAKEEEALAMKRLTIINQELAIKKQFGEDVNDLLDAQKDAEIQLINSQAKNVETQRAIGQKRREIERDITEQRLDILIDGADKIKTVNEKIIADENLSIELRRAKLKETETLLAGSYQAQLAQVSSYVNDYSVLQELVNEQDAIQLQKKIENLGANEIIGNRILEIVKERKQAIQDFADIQKQLDNEEITRKKEAETKIAEIENNKTNFVLENELKKLETVKESEAKQLEIRQQILTNQIEFEKQSAAILLENTKLTELERQAIINESEFKILQLQTEFDTQKLENKKETDKILIEQITSNFERITEITRNFAGSEAAIFSDITTTLVKVFEDGKLGAEETFVALAAIATSSFSAISDSRTKDLSDLQKWKDEQLKIYEGAEETQLMITEYVAEREREIKLKQFRADKAKAIIDIGIATAVAITKSLPNIPLSISVGLLGAIQSGVVLAKQPNFATGTNDIVSIGDSHASGNDVKVFGIDGKGKTQFFGNVERGEAMPVIRKSAINDYQIAKLNGHFSSKHSERTFASGTNDITNSNSNITLSDLQFLLSNLPESVVRVEDITTAQRNKVIVRNNATI